MSRNAIKAASIVLTAGLAALAQPAAAQLQSAAPFVPTTPPGAMTINGDFHTIALCNNIVGAKYSLNPQSWNSWVIDHGKGNLLNRLSAPAGPLPTGGIVFVDHGYNPDQLLRWDPGVGVTYMNNQSSWPAGLSTIPGGTSDVICGRSILLIGGNGRLYEREIVGANAWTNHGNQGWPLAGKPEVAVDRWNGDTFAAVIEDQGRLWILSDVCSNLTWNRVGATGQPGDNPFAYCTGLGAGMDGGKFFVTADYYTGGQTDLWEAGQWNGAWGWYNHGHPAWSTAFVGNPVSSRDALHITAVTASGTLEIAYLQYDTNSGVWLPWASLGSPPGDAIAPGTLTAEWGANRVVVKGTSGKFWTLINNGSGWGWEDRGLPACR